MVIPIHSQTSAVNRAALLKELFSANWREANLRQSFLVNVPLRICPLGAHSDHQGGSVTGLTIDRSIELLGAPIDTPEIAIASANFRDRRRYSLANIPSKVEGDWGNYACGVVKAFSNRGIKLTRGFVGVIHGEMPIGGLSSSAAVTIAYIKALEQVNNLSLSTREIISLVRETENGYLGLHNGILDQSVILSGKKGALSWINCASEEMEALEQLATTTQWKILVVYSGLSRQLIATPFNQRVAECRQAARELLSAAGLHWSEGSRLGDVSESIFQDYHHALPRNLQLRARHFFSEMERVRQGRQAWIDGDMQRFGGLVTASGESSISQFESGSPALISLYEVLREGPGVLGARFCGGGFQGCCLALIDAEKMESISEAVHEGYVAKHPELAEAYSMHFCESAGSVSVKAAG